MSPRAAATRPIHAGPHAARVEPAHTTATVLAVLRGAGASPAHPRSPARRPLRRRLLHREQRAFLRSRSLAHGTLECAGKLRILLQRLGRLLPPGPDPLAIDREPGAVLLHQAAVASEVQQLMRPRDPDAVEDVELRLPEGRSELVLHDFHASARADHLLAILDGTDAADVEADGGIELQRVAARGGLG